MADPLILHETATRIRLRLPTGQDAGVVGDRLREIRGVREVRPNPRLHCVTVRHDGTATTRAAVLRALGRRDRGGPGRSGRSAVPTVPDGGRGSRRPSHRAGVLGPALLAAAVPLVPRAWRPAAALGVVGMRVATRIGRGRADAPAVLLDSASLAALALTGHPLVVSASVLLRLAVETLSTRLVEQADDLLEHLLPNAADTCRVLARDGAIAGLEASRRPLRELRAGDRLVVAPPEVVPADGWVEGGRATLHPLLPTGAPRAVDVGDHVVAGERVLDGELVLRAESGAAGSRLERLRAHDQHAIAGREPTGRFAVEMDRLVSLPLTGAALVLGLTGDSARAAAMLQADPQSGLDMALPVAREAALYALARHGLLTAGLEPIERLATARTLVLQDTAVAATGRWTLDDVATEAGGDAGRVAHWLATLAAVPAPALRAGGLADATVRQWVRHGAVLRLAGHELHLAGPRRLREIWGLGLPAPAAPGKGDALRRTFAFVADGRVVARVVLASPLRPGTDARLQRLREAGFERIALFIEDDGGDDGDDDGGRVGAVRWQRSGRLDCLADDLAARREWLAEAGADGSPVVMVHTVLRDLVPPGSLSLTTTEAQAGAHGVLLADPLATLESARRLSRDVHRRLRLQQNAAIGANAALMTAAALRRLPPIATSVLHHGFALAVLVDSLRLERVDVSVPPGPPAPPSSGRVRQNRSNVT